MITATKERSIITFVNTTNNKIARFDLKDNSCYTFYNNKFNKVKNLKHFFSGYNTQSIIDGFEDEKYKKFIQKIWDNEDKCSNVGTLLERLCKYSNLENYILMNIKVDKRVKAKSSEFNKYILKYIIERDFRLSSDFEKAYMANKDLILKIIRFINENYDVDLNKKVWRFIKTWQFKDYFIPLVNTYNYDYKTLLNYIFDYLPNREAFTIDNYNIRELSDYVDMQSAMSKNNKFNKYPKYLKTVHDITVLNYNTFKKEYSNELFLNRVDVELSYESQKDNYIIIVPKCCEDVKQEGVDMHNCVGGYIDKIIDGKTQIVFLRRFNKPNESLATVEIRDNKLIQSFRAYNTNLQEDDVKFLKKYCKIKNIEYKLKY